MRLWKIGPDWVIAKDETDVFRVEFELCELARDESGGERPREVPRDEIITMVNIDDFPRHPCEPWMRDHITQRDEQGGVVSVAAPAHVWLENTPRGILGSEEW